MARFGTVKQQMKNISASAAAQPQEIRERRVAAEEFKSAVDASLGAPGTYDLPTSAQPSPVPPAAPAPSGPAPTPGLLSRDGYTFGRKKDVKKYDKLIKKGFTPEEARSQMGGDRYIAEDSIFKSTKTGTGAAGGTGGDINQRTLSLDKDKAMAQVQGSSAYRQMSRMMAESEQLLARTGPLYDEMIKSTQLPIIEGAAAAARENTENLRSAMARGGSARRDAFEAIAKIRAQDQINMQKGQALAAAHMQLDMWARDNAKNVINFAQNWSSNLAGVRESFHSAMDNAASLMASSSLPVMFAAANKAQEYRMAQSAQSRGKVNRWITGILGIATGVMTAYRGGDASGSLNMLNQVSEGAKSAASGAADIGEAIGGGLKSMLTKGSGTPSAPVAGPEGGTGGASNNYYSGTV